MVGLDSLGAAGRAAAACWVRRGAPFRVAVPVFRRFAAPEAFALFFFFMRILVEAAFEGLPGFTKTG
jgi:hypothetical protein